MKGFYINTRSFPIDETNINYVHLFTSITGNTYFPIASSSLLYNDYISYSGDNKNSNSYTINLDWFQFICKPKYNMLMLDSYKSSIIHIEKNTTHNNPNFRYNYKIYYRGVEVCEFYTNPLNNKHTKDEVSCKVTNSILYVKNWTYLIEYILHELNMEIIRLSKIAIALDGYSNLEILDLCRRYLRNRTIQINNDKIEIAPIKFKKSELKWSGYNIGSKKYQKYARIYDKVAEIKRSGKTYIIDFWKCNGINIDEVARFELELGNRHLKNYQFNSLHDFLDSGFLAKILHSELINWLKFYKVRLSDIKQYRKAIAIRKGKEKAFIAWEKLPQSIISLNTIDIMPNDLLNAKKTITFALRQISNSRTTEITDQTVNYIYNVTSQYNLQRFTFNKINFIYSNQLPFDNLHPIKKLMVRLDAEAYSGG